MRTVFITLSADRQWLIGAPDQGLQGKNGPTPGADMINRLLTGLACQQHDLVDPALSKSWIGAKLIDQDIGTNAL